VREETRGEDKILTGWPDDHGIRLQEWVAMVCLKVIPGNDSSSTSCTCTCREEVHMSELLGHCLTAPQMTRMKAGNGPGGHCPQ
jgi:hypothetical protein